MSIPVLGRLLPASIVAPCAATMRQARGRCATAPSAAAPARVAPAGTEASGRAKKPRHKKLARGETGQGVALPRPLPPPPPPPERPGKKQLRRLRYQQQHLSAQEFLLASAENCVFTESVRIQQSSSRLNPEGEKEASDRATPRIVVRTSSEPLDAASDSLPAQDDERTTVVQVKPLLILDLNGILCHRVRPERASYDPPPRYRASLGTVARTPVIPRPHLAPFLDFLQAHFALAVWTSAKTKTAAQLVRLLVPDDVARRLLFVWAQDACGVVRAPASASGGAMDEVLFEKDLTKVWRAYPLWGTHNTVLMDDSPEKCAAVTGNAVHPAALHGREASDAAVAGGDGGGGALAADEATAARQLAFLRRLAQHWAAHPLRQEWAPAAAAPVHRTTRSLAEFLGEHGSDI